MTIHSQPGRQPTPQAKIILPEDAASRSADPSHQPAQQPVEPAGHQIAQQTPSPEASEASLPDRSPLSTRFARSHTIVVLAALSLLPGVTARLAPGFWEALAPEWRWGSYALSGVLIVAVTLLIMKRDPQTGD